MSYLLLELFQISIHDFTQKKACEVKTKSEQFVMEATIKGHH